MPQVPPGDATGLYYILVSSLPWNCTWQRLKDFARNQDNEGKCTAVEHTKVYKESTCGWITVRGKEDFLKALGMSSNVPHVGKLTELVKLTYKEACWMAGHCVQMVETRQNGLRFEI